MNAQVAMQDDRRTAGFALFAVLSFSLLAATVAAPFLTGARTRALVARNVAAELRRDMIARGLMHIAAARFVELRKAPDFAMPSKVNCQIGPASVVFTFQGHGGLIDLNLAPKDLLMIGFGALGYDTADADRLAEAVVRFRAADTRLLNDHSEHVRGGYKHAAFETVSELGDFQGISGKTQFELQELFTVHNGTGTIYSDQVSDHLLMALKTLPETQTYFVVQGTSPSTAVSIRTEVSNPGRPAFQIAAVVRGTDTEIGYAFLSPMKVDTVSEFKRSGGISVECGQFFSEQMFATMNTIVAEQ